MAKPRNRAADLAVYLLIRLIAAILRALPFSIALRFAGGLAWVLKRVAPKRVRIARENVEQAFPGQYDEAGFQQLVESRDAQFRALAGVAFAEGLIVRDPIVRPHVFKD